MYTSIFVICFVFKFWQKQISKKLQNCKGGTIVKRLDTKPRSRDQALGGGPGQNPRKLLGFRHIKDQNQHFEPPFFF